MGKRTQRRTEVTEGMQFGRYTVLKEVEPDKNGNRRVLCRCSCGKTREVLLYALTSGITKSCGCLQKEIISDTNTKHGFYKERLYKVWDGMKQRCNNPNSSRYASYGGRGIKVCKEWNDSYLPFREFMLSHGYDPDAPKGQCTIDRIDNDGDYCPENCRVINNHEQQLHKESTKKYNYHGKLLTIDQAVVGKEITRSGVEHRIKKLGWDFERAVDTPLRKVRTYKVHGTEYTLKELAKLLQTTVNKIYGRLTYTPDIEEVVARIIAENNLDIKF